MAVALYNCIKREDDGTYGHELTAAQTPAIGWAAGGLLSITFSAAEGILGVGGGLSVDAVAVTGSGWAFPSGAFRLGGRLGGAMEAFGRYKNPRRSWFPAGPIV